MRRELPGFSRRVPELVAIWFMAPVYGKQQKLAKPLEHALEVAYLCGCMDAVGCAVGWPEDDTQVRALELQQQAAARLATLREETNNEHWTVKPIHRANGEVKRRMRNIRFD